MKEWIKKNILRNHLRILYWNLKFRKHTDVLDEKYEDWVSMEISDRNNSDYPILRCDHCDFENGKKYAPLEFSIHIYKYQLKTK